MKKYAAKFHWMCLLGLALMSLTLTGCGTSRADQVNASERPWNSPTSWQQNGAMGVMDQQRR